MQGSKSDSPKENVLIITAGDIQKTSVAQQATYAAFLAKIFQMDSLEDFIGGTDKGNLKEIMKRLMKLLRDLIQGFNSSQGIYLLLHVVEIARGTLTGEKLIEELGINQALANKIFRGAQALVLFFNEFGFPIERLDAIDKNEQDIYALAQARDQALVQEFRENYDNQHGVNRQLIDTIAKIRDRVKNLQVIIITSSPPELIQVMFDKNEALRGVVYFQDVRFFHDLSLKEGKDSTRFIAFVREIQSKTREKCIILTSSQNDREALDSSGIQYVGSHQNGYLAELEQAFLT